MRITLTIGGNGNDEFGGVAHLFCGEGKLTDRLLKTGLLLAGEGLHQLWHLTQTLLASVFG